MNTLKYRMRSSLAPLAALGLFACFGAGTWVAVAELPGIFDAPPDLDSYEGRGESNWFGQGLKVVFAFCFLLLVVIYVEKWWITGIDRVRTAVFWYSLSVACSLPYIWFLLVPDWHNPFIYRFSCWVYDPIAIWAVPTISFAWDVSSQRKCSYQRYIARSLFEIVLLFPAWFVFWAVFSLFFLGAGWI
jgi:hypothetical protein